MEPLKIIGEARERTGKGIARSLRREGRVPAIAYGHGIEQPLAVSVPRHEMVLMLRSRTGPNTRFQLVVGEQSYPCIVREYQVHPISRRLTHCDFLVYDEEHSVLAEVPVETTGKSKGEEIGARLFRARPEVKVRCLARLIPECLVIDVSELDTGDVLYVDQVDYPDGVVPVYRTRYPVIVLSAPKADVEEEEEEAGEEEDLEEAVETDEE